jgi:hypothetical protein
MKLLFILALVGGIGYTIYWFFLKDKIEAAVNNEPLPPFNPNPEDLKPKTDPHKEPDFIFLYAGETINRNGKTYTWNKQLNKYIEVK